MPLYPVINLKTKEKKKLFILLLKNMKNGKKKIPIGIKIGVKDVLALDLEEVLLMV